MRTKAVWIAVSMLVVAAVLAYLATGRNHSGLTPSKTAKNAGSPSGERQTVDSPQSQTAAPNSEAKKVHPLLGTAADAVLRDGGAIAAETTASRLEPEKLHGLMQTVIAGVKTAGDVAQVTIDYPLDQSIFPPEIVPPTFLWHEPNERADTWLIDVALAEPSQHIRVLSPGNPPPAGPIDPACIAPSNELYKPTEYQASARSWTPDAQVWAAIKRGSAAKPAEVAILGFRSDKPDKVLSRGAVAIITSRDPVGAPIFYRDVPLAPALTEKGVIRPLGEDAVALIGWRLRDVSLPESRLLLTDVPTCTNCHSFSSDGKTLGMDLDGPQGDKGAYVVAPVARRTEFAQKDIIQWNSFPQKPAGHKTIGFLSRVSPDGQYVVTTLNEEVYVCNFLDYRFLQVFFPTRGILGYYSGAGRTIHALPGADDPKYVHCDAVWTPDGQQLVFARAEAKNAYPADGRLARQANDPAETQIQYDLCRMPFRDGKGGKPEAIAGASANGMSNTFPKVSPDGKWVVFAQCRNGQLLRPDSKLWIVPLAGGKARVMRCNTSQMNSWHSFSPNGRWLVFSSKANTPYTQMFLTHVDAEGNDSPAILLPNSTASNRAVNLPEFANIAYDQWEKIEVPAIEYYRCALRGVALAKAGRLDEAIAAFDKAVELQPDFQHAHVEAAVALAKKGSLDTAIARLNKALALDPKNSRALGNAGIVLARSGRLDEAKGRFLAALEIDPYYRTAHANLARILLEQGKIPQATQHFRRTAELDEADPLSHFELAEVLAKQGMLQEAVEQYRKTIARDPKAVEPYLAIAKAFAALGDYRSAVAHLQMAMQADPNNVRPVSDLAWMLAVCPDDEVRNGQMAVSLASRACAATNHKNPVLLHTLSAAYAETGDFSNATTTAAQALELVGPQDASTAQWIRQSLRRFHAGKPCRQLPGEATK